MIRPARAANVADWQALVAVIERSQIRLPKPLPRTQIPTKTRWTSPSSRGSPRMCAVCVSQLKPNGYSLTLRPGRPLDLPKCTKREAICEEESESLV